MLLLSYLIEVRGLKQQFGSALIAAGVVVSYRGTWIETCLEGWGNAYVMSYLIEVRGLKLEILKAFEFMEKSYLIEVRGLKLILLVVSYQSFKVVSYRGTWIETIICKPANRLKIVVSYRGTWIETGIARGSLRYVKSYLIEVRGLKLWNHEQGSKPS